jgi:hypothetical protein
MLTLDIAGEYPKNANMDKIDVPESKISLEQIKRQLGPCGIYCGKCYAFSDGAIKHHSAELLEALGNFEPYARRFVELLEEPVFGKYPDFKEMLAHFANGGCQGCRNDDCKLFKGCGVKECSRDKAVNFCFQCPEFPCDHTGFDINLQKRWLAINKRMKEIGVERYFAEIKDKSRY